MRFMPSLRVVALQLNVQCFSEDTQEESAHFRSRYRKETGTHRYFTSVNGTWSPKTKAVGCFPPVTDVIRSPTRLSPFLPERTSLTKSLQFAPSLSTEEAPANSLTERTLTELRSGLCSLRSSSIFTTSLWLLQELKLRPAPFSPPQRHFTAAWIYQLQL